MGFALSELQLKSPAFEPQGEIPAKYTGEGQDISPPLQWSNVPNGTRSFALICHDPDAPLVFEGAYGFVHWVLYNIPGSVTSLSEGIREYTSGPNGSKKEGYMGPMPPNGHGTDSLVPTRGDIV
jgi:Raf kinase inhibitor-like YbhB/YbcL family protein